MGDVLRLRRVVDEMTKTFVFVNLVRSFCRWSALECLCLLLHTFDFDKILSCPVKFRWLFFCVTSLWNGHRYFDVSLFASMTLRPVQLQHAHLNGVICFVCIMAELIVVFIKPRLISLRLLRPPAVSALHGLRAWR